MPKALWDWNRVYPTDGVRRLNAFPPEELVGEFLRCCPDERWARGMAAVRPFRNSREVFEASDRLLERLGGVGMSRDEIADRLARLLEF